MGARRTETLHALRAHVHDELVSTGLAGRMPDGPPDSEAHERRPARLRPVVSTLGTSRRDTPDERVGADHRGVLLNLSRVLSSRPSETSARP